MPSSCISRVCRFYLIQKKCFAVKISPIDGPTIGARGSGGWDEEGGGVEHDKKRTTIMRIEKVLVDLTRRLVVARRTTICFHKNFVFICRTQI